MRYRYHEIKKQSWFHEKTVQAVKRRKVEGQCYVCFSHHHSVSHTVSSVCFRFLCDVMFLAFVTLLLLLLRPVYGGAQEAVDQDVCRVCPEYVSSVCFVWQSVTEQVSWDSWQSHCGDDPSLNPCPKMCCRYSMMYSTARHKHTCMFSTESFLPESAPPKADCSLHFSVTYERHMSSLKTKSLSIFLFAVLSHTFLRTDGYFETLFTCGFAKCWNKT